MLWSSLELLKVLSVLVVFLLNQFQWHKLLKHVGLLCVRVTNKLQKTYPTKAVIAHANQVMVPVSYIVEVKTSLPQYWHVTRTGVSLNNWTATKVGCWCANTTVDELVSAKKDKYDIKNLECVIYIIILSNALYKTRANFLVFINKVARVLRLHR